MSPFSLSSGNTNRVAPQLAWLVRQRLEQLYLLQYRAFSYSHCNHNHLKLVVGNVKGMGKVNEVLMKRVHSLRIDGFLERKKQDRLFGRKIHEVMDQLLKTQEALDQLLERYYQMMVHSLKVQRPLWMIKWEVIELQLNVQLQMCVVASLLGREHQWLGELTPLRLS